MDKVTSYPLSSSLHVGTADGYLTKMDKLNLIHRLVTKDHLSWHNILAQKMCVL